MVNCLQNKKRFYNFLKIFRWKENYLLKPGRETPIFRLVFNILLDKLADSEKITNPLRFLQKLEDLLFQEQKRKLSEKAWKRSFFIGGQPRLVQSTGLNKPMDMVKVLYQRRPGPGYFLFWIMKQTHKNKMHQI